METKELVEAGLITELRKMFCAPSTIKSNMVIDYFECSKCGTMYPQMWVWDNQESDYVLRVMCNGQEIKECPYCKNVNHLLT